VTDIDIEPQAQAAQEGRRVRWRTALLALLGVLAAALVGVGTLVAVRHGEALPGTTVAGVDVGGLGREDIRTRLQDAVDTRTTGTLDLVHEELRFSVDRSELAVSVDVDATADRAVQAGRENGLDRVLGPVLGRGEPVDLRSSVEQGPLRERVEQIAAEVDRDPSPGGIVVEGTSVTPVLPAEGREVRREEALEDLTEALLTGRQEPLPIPMDVEDPGTTAAQVEAVAAQAGEVLTAPLRLSAPEASLEVTPTELAPLLVTGPADGGIELYADYERLTALVEAKAARINRAPREAGFDVPQPATVDTQGNLTWSPQPASVSVRPGEPGLSVRVDEAVTALDTLVRQGGREAPLAVESTEPRFNAADVSSAGVTSLLGTFTTYFASGQNRASNIRRIASVVDGTYVRPGDRFSLNGVAGPRTRAKGYLADGAIVNGELEDVVGGGVSQFATTLFNAAFFAGLPIEQHKPHSFYISRYPAGRESTVNFGSIDVRIRNDTANGMVVKTWSTPGSVTVGIFGDNGGRTVTSTSGPREPRSGGGFAINVTRTITGGDGRGERRVFRTVYNPPPD
jgi:vancomycin resistance protein YoaR